jgi:hypothetical protein
MYPHVRDRVVTRFGIGVSRGRILVPSGSLFSDGVGSGYSLASGDTHPKDTGETARTRVVSWPKMRQKEKDWPDRPTGYPGGLCSGARSKRRNAHPPHTAASWQSVHIDLPPSPERCSRPFRVKLIWIFFFCSRFSPSARLDPAACFSPAKLSHLGDLQG